MKKNLYYTQSRSKCLIISALIHLVFLFFIYSYTFGVNNFYKRFYASSKLLNKIPPYVELNISLGWIILKALQPSPP